MSFNYETLDPGIRETVQALHAAGFETTDSGDGVSKPADERAFDYPHVAVHVGPRERLFAVSDGVQAVLGPAWRVEGSYCPTDGSVLVLAYDFAKAQAQGDGGQS